MKIFTVLGLIFSFFFGALRYGFTPTVVFDASVSEGVVSSRASGYLYGLAEPGVPDPLTVYSLDPACAAQKVIGGLQHPIGDVDRVAENLDRSDYIVVYLQDAFSTWYYANDDIVAARRAGTYDWQTFLTETYFPLVREKVLALRDKPYADRLVYCLYNECDNGVWFGTWQPEGEWAAFDDAGCAAFFEAWKQTCALVRSLAPGAMIGGPGYYEYNAEKERRFLTYCAANGCLPDAMIWHELGELSSEQLDLHVAEYRALEESLGVAALPVLITEYGMMEECGDPARMFRYIRQIEETGVYGCIAYWRLADNLCENSADGVSPNSCWWLYRWYADMEGQHMHKEVRDLFHADFGKAVREARQLRYKHFNGFGSVSDAGDLVTALVGGADYTGQVRFINLDKTALGKKVKVTVESISFQGLGGKVYAPVTLREYTAAVRFGSLTVKMENMDANAVYRIALSPADGSADYTNDNIPQRYEFENGTLLGSAYTYDSAYASTGETAGLVGGMEHEGDGVRLLINVPQTGNYDLSAVYGKANDGASPADRVTGTANVRVDDVACTLSLPNTIRSEYTSLAALTVWLERGDHTVEFFHGEGTFVLDSLLVARHEAPSGLRLLYEHELSSEAQTCYLAVTPENGWYLAETAASGLRVNGCKCESPLVYLRQGLNVIALDGAGQTCKIYKSKGKTDSFTFTAPQLALSGGAEIKNGAVTGVTSEGGAASFTVTVPQAGDWWVTLTYANNAEGGYHAYNVDLIEQYFTVTVNGQSKNVWCRNTYSSENLSTATFGVQLAAGENVFTFTNDGTMRFNGRPNGTPELHTVTLNPAFLPVE